VEGELRFKYFAEYQQPLLCCPCVEGIVILVVNVDSIESVLLDKCCQTHSAVRGISLSSGRGLGISERPDDYLLSLSPEPLHEVRLYL
jgi:hypothetical protein